MTPRRSPVEPAADVAQVVDDVELIAPWALLLAAALVGIAATGGLQFLIVPGPRVDLVLFLTDLLWK